MGLLLAESTHGLVATARSWVGVFSSCSQPLAGNRGEGGGGPAPNPSLQEEEGGACGVAHHPLRHGCLPARGWEQMLSTPSQDRAGMMGALYLTRASYIYIYGGKLCKSPRTSHASAPMQDPAHAPCPRGASQCISQGLSRVISVATMSSTTRPLPCEMPDTKSLTAGGRGGATCLTVQRGCRHLAWHQWSRDGIHRCH